MFAQELAVRQGRIGRDQGELREVKRTLCILNIIWKMLFISFLM
jgi:hypothetical protein